MTAIHLYHTWIEKIRQMCPNEHAKRIQSFAFLLVGLYLAKSVHLSHMARELPGKVQQRSKSRRLGRIVDNNALDVRPWYEPVARAILETIHAHGQPIRLLVDGTKVGAGHQLLMVAVAYRRRALPLCWTWVRSARGHSSAYKQASLLSYLRSLIPAKAEVIVAGDSEFGSVPLMRTLDQWDWFYVFRQKGRTLVRLAADAEWVRLDSLLAHRGESRWLPSIWLTQKHDFTCHLYACWRPGEAQPWLLATNLPTQRRTHKIYSRRMWIDEMFGDFKAHGFDLEATRLRHFLRLSRLTLAVSLLYLWCIAFGSSVVKRGLRYLVDRSDRRDLSYFRIGLDMIQRRLANQDSLILRLVPYF